MVGRTLARVAMSKAKGSDDRISFAFQDGSEAVFDVEGDCCSSSWIEHLELPGEVNGAVVLSVEDSDAVDATENDALNPLGGTSDDEYRSREHESLQVYHTRINTDRGEIVLEYRNSSNGYYGGYLSEVTP